MAAPVAGVPGEAVPLAGEEVPDDEEADGELAPPADGPEVLIGLEEDEGLDGDPGLLPSPPGLPTPGLVFDGASTPWSCGAGVDPSATAFCGPRCGAIPSLGLAAGAILSMPDDRAGRAGGTAIGWTVGGGGGSGEGVRRGGGGGCHKSKATTWVTELATSPMFIAFVAATHA